jgi:hypothetical protein
MPCDVTLLVLPSGAPCSTKFFACVAPEQIPAQTRRGLAAEHRPPALPKRIRRKRADARNRGRLCHRETLDDLRDAGFHCAPPLPNQGSVAIGAAMLAAGAVFLFLWLLGNQFACMAR